MEKTARCVTTAVKKLVSPEEDEEEAAYDRADDLVTGLRTDVPVRSDASS